jgi:predicted chitinase
MITFDRDKFFEGYKSSFGTLTQSLSEAISFLLDQIEKDDRFNKTDVDIQKLSYCLATFKWETAHTMKPIDEHGSDEYFEKRYGYQTKVGKILGNTQEGDGALFHGRGYVQITGRTNYNSGSKLTGINLVEDPERAKEPEIAYQIAIYGMTNGMFTGAKLSKFFKEDQDPDYYNARTIINGHDQAQKIADIAIRFDTVIASSIV